MNWTKELPTKTGYYWFRAMPPQLVTVVEIDTKGGQWLAYFPGWEIPYQKDDAGLQNAEWFGPLEPPI
jgi:hypothetical protein